MKDRIIRYLKMNWTVVKLNCIRLIVPQIWLNFTANIDSKKIRGKKRRKEEIEEEGEKKMKEKNPIEDYYENKA
jgi:plasmid maintenance system antidote protein VapI